MEINFLFPERYAAFETKYQYTLAKLNFGNCHSRNPLSGISRSKKFVSSHFNGSEIKRGLEIAKLKQSK